MKARTGHEEKGTGHPWDSGGTPAVQWSAGAPAGGAAAGHESQTHHLHGLQTSHSPLRTHDTSRTTRTRTWHTEHSFPACRQHSPNLRWTNTARLTHGTPCTCLQMYIHVCFRTLWTLPSNHHHICPFSIQLRRHMKGSTPKLHVSTGGVAVRFSRTTRVDLLSGITLLTAQWRLFLGNFQPTDDMKFGRSSRATLWQHEHSRGYICLSII